MRKNNKFYILFLLASCFTFTSCLVDDDVASDVNDQGPNLIGFTTGSFAATKIADGEAEDINLVLEVVGPTETEMTGDVSVNITVDPASTAVEGVHYNLPQTSFTVEEANNYIKNVPLTILSEGINPPLDEDPQLILHVTDVTSEENVLVNGRTETIVVDFLYLCESALAGSYQVVTNGVNMGVEQIVQVAPGTYKTITTGTWAPGAIAPDQGLTFRDQCDNLTVPFQNLAQGYYANEVYGISPDGVDGTVDENGDFTLTYEITFPSGNQVYTANYTRLD